MLLQVAPYVTKVVIGQDALSQIGRIQRTFTVQQCWITTLELHCMPFELLAEEIGFAGALKKTEFRKFFKYFPYVI